MAESEPRKRRGRPRVSEEEKKSHTLTFRMRSDLRDAVEELAEANGRTLSEQVEYYVDAAVFTEAGLIYQYSTEAMSPTLFKCVSNRTSNQDAKSIVHLNISFPSEHREMLTIAGKNYLNNPETPGFLPWVKGPGGREGAVAMVRAMLAATRDGTIKAMVEAVGSEAVKAALDEEARAKQSASSQPQQTAMKPDLLAHVSGCTLEANGSIDENCRHNFSISALRQLLDRSKDNPQDLVAIRSAGWPQRFEELPADTRAKLIGDLQQGAAPAYQALMSSKGSRGEALEAFRRLQRALLPREPADEGDEEWPDEGPSHDPDAAAVGRPAPHR